MSKTKSIDFRSITLRSRITHRGGGLEISLDTLGFKGHKMTAYQNYLGGGMLGSIGNDCTAEGWEGNKKLQSIAEKLAEYFHSLTNPDEDEWESMSFEQVQNMPRSAY